MTRPESLKNYDLHSHGVCPARAIGRVVPGCGGDMSAHEGKTPERQNMRTHVGLHYPPALMSNLASSAVLVDRRSCSPSIGLRTGSRHTLLHVFFFFFSTNFIRRLQLKTNKKHTNLKKLTLTLHPRSGAQTGIKKKMLKPNTSKSSSSSSSILNKTVT